MSKSLQVLNCDGCGACCMHMGGTPAMLAWSSTRQRNDIRAYFGPPLPPAINREMLATIADWKANGTWPGDDDPCIWFDANTRKCRHYEHRPNVCRTFAVGSKACLSHRERRGIGGGR